MSAPEVNALKELVHELKQGNRNLKEQTRVIAALNESLVELIKELREMRANIKEN